MQLQRETVEFKHFHFFCGLGGGADGFNKGKAAIGSKRAHFRCIGGVDSNPSAIRNFDKRAGVRGTCIDLFDREQYVAFHGHEPPAGWREATPADIRRAAYGEFPDVVFLSAPCKGFSGLLSETKSKTGKYQALNRLTLRGVWLMCEAFKDNPPSLILFENVPRIANRGRQLLNQIEAIIRSYGYAYAETTHDCGEIGNLAQSRKRFLMVARHMEKVPSFLYQPPKRGLRSVGEILDRMPLPGDPLGGPMHSVPNLQWKTWVRLAFVEAGSDWRSLNKLKVVDGKLADYLIVPDMYRGTLGVTGWDEHSATVTGNARPVTGNFSVADPRQKAFDRGYGVCDWQEAAHAVQGKSAPSNGEFAVSDPRMKGSTYPTYGVLPWDRPMGTVTSQSDPGGGTFSVADPRTGHEHHQNVYRVTAWDHAAHTITGSNHASGGAPNVADPRPVMSNPYGKYAIAKWDGKTGTVIGSDDSGAYGVADPRAPETGHGGGGKYRVTPFDAPAGTVIAESGTGNGGFAVADPRAMDRGKGDSYLTGGHYGVVPWEGNTGAVSGSACHDNGPWSVADPRMPEATEKLACIIRALDGTWHRPFTTLELAALQSLVDPEEMFAGYDLDGKSDSEKREQIGNAVPPDAAQAIADMMAHTLLLAQTQTTMMLSLLPVWVQPVAVALSVKTFA